MSGWITAAVVAASVLSTAGSVYAAKKQSKATLQAAEMQKETAEKSLSQQYEAMNQQNQKSADIESILERNTGSDDSATMLTGAMGLNPLNQKLLLGKGANMLGG